jgi:hypothetical protein
MNKLNVITLFSLIVLGQSVQATDMYIKMEIFPERQQKIYNEIVSYSGLAKAKKDNYHLTLAKIKDAQGIKNGQELRGFLIGELNQACRGTLNREHAIILKDVHAGPYTVNRHYDNSPIVLFPDPGTTGTLKNYNLILNKALAKFNESHRTNFEMDNDLIPAKYAPHITLANARWINEKSKFKRKEIINTLNEKIEVAKQKNKRPTYDFMLIVPEK